MINKVLSGLIQAYQATAAFFLGGRCRFYPSCSDYALDALKRHRFMKAAALIVSRLCRCHPLSKGGADFAP